MRYTPYFSANQRAEVFYTLPFLWFIRGNVQWNYPRLQSRNSIQANVDRGKKKTRNELYISWLSDCVRSIACLITNWHLIWLWFALLEMLQSSEKYNPKHNQFQNNYNTHSLYSAASLLLYNNSFSFPAWMILILLLLDSLIVICFVSIWLIILSPAMV